MASGTAGSFSVVFFSLCNSYYLLRAGSFSARSSFYCLVLKLCYQSSTSKTAIFYQQKRYVIMVRVESYIGKPLLVAIFNCENYRNLISNRSESPPDHMIESSECPNQIDTRMQIEHCCMFIGFVFTGILIICNSFHVQVSLFTKQYVS